MSFSSGLHYFLTTTAFFGFFLFYILATQERSDHFFKFDDEVDHMDIHRLQQMEHHVDFYTGNCTDKSQKRDIDGDGVNDCEDAFPLWDRATKRTKYGYPNCDCRQLKGSNNTNPLYDCGIHKTSNDDKAMCEESTWPRKDNIRINNDGHLTFKYYFQDIPNLDAKKRTRNAECISAYYSAQAAGYSCDGRTENMWSSNSDGHFSPEALHCTELVCCAMENNQKKDDTSDLVSDDYNTAAKCKNNWDFSRLYVKNRTEFDQNTDFRAETTMSLTHFCSYTSSPAKTDQNPDKNCIKIEDALTLYGRQGKTYETMNNIYHNPDVNKSFAIWWYAQWVLFGLSFVHVLLVVFGHIIDDNSYSVDLGTYFAEMTDTDWKKAACKFFWALIIFSVFAVSVTVFVYYIMFMSGDNFQTNQTINMHTSSNTNLTIGPATDKNSYAPFEFFDYKQKDSCPEEMKETDCIILGNVQHHVFKTASDRWQTWSVFLLIAYMFQIAAAFMFFMSLVFTYFDIEDPNKTFSGARIGSAAPGSSSASKVGSSTSTPTTGTQTQKRVVSAYASGKIKNGSMKF